MKLGETARNSFYQLLAVYSALVLLVALGFFEKFSMQLHFFAIVIAVIGIAILPKDIGKKERKIHYWIFAAAVFFVVLLRFLPYIDNSIPLGYDAGIYKYGIEHGLENRDGWILGGGMEPGFLYLMIPIKAFFSTDAILKWVFIGFCAILGAAIFVLTKELGRGEAAVFSTIIYAFSVVQFKVFELMYYKNVIGLSFMLFAVYFLIRHEKEKNKWFLIAFLILGGVLLAIHRPTFYIFGLSYGIYAFVSPIGEKYELKKMKENIYRGVVICLIGVAFYLGDFWQALTKILPFVAQGFVSPGESPGTFISFFSYGFSTLFYLPIALLGLFYFLRRKEFNFVVIWVVINLAIVYFQFFFFNRFIIHLDVALIIFSGIGFVILKQDRKFSTAMITILIVSGAVIAFDAARNAEPLISSDTLELIEKIPELTGADVKVISISSKYSPWIKGYSDRETIAPGLFDENEWSEEEWQEFWDGASEERTLELMEAYSENGREIYLFAGTKSFNNPCFSVFSENEGGKIYEYAC